MKQVLANVLLGLAWLAVTGEFTIANFAIGLFVGMVSIWVAGNALGSHDYYLRVRAAVRLVATFAYELTVSTLRIAADVVTPTLSATPAIVAVELEPRSDLELLLLSIFVTLTPGSVVVHVPDDRGRLYVYGMYVEDRDAFRRRILDVFDRRILAVTRGPAQEGT